KEVINGLRFFRVESYSGAPGKASPELGEKILETLARQAAQAMCEVFEGTLPREQWHSPLWSKRFWFINPLIVRFVNRVLQVPRGVA
ncbi:MAG TPA: hypothetical protein VEB21_09540, partial [Terriglobales bacterium]|nr:hypothetical protein [Terriglobales bacterium]